MKEGSFMYCKQCGRNNPDDNTYCTGCGAPLKDVVYVVPDGGGVTCPNCGSHNCQVINEVHTTGTDFSGGKACCGYLLFGWIGILCGMCGSGKKVHNTNYWVCNNCGRKWKV